MSPVCGSGVLSQLQTPRSMDRRSNVVFSPTPLQNSGLCWYSETSNLLSLGLAQCFGLSDALFEQVRPHRLQRATKNPLRDFSRVLPTM
jgi:hypothetical protein